MTSYTSTVQAKLPRQTIVVPLWRKRFLTLAEASAYSGFGKQFVTDHLAGYPVGPRGSIVYKRSDLDMLDPGDPPLKQDSA
jgi:hypothetical protein